MKRSIALVVALLSAPALAGGPTLDESLNSILSADLDAGDRIAQIDTLFDESDASGDERARAHLNAAASLCEAGLLEAAAAHCVEADRAARGDALRAASRFNLGQTRFRRAGAALQPADGAQPDIEGAKVFLRRSADAFRAVLDIDPADAEAARNVERVRRMIERIDEMQRQAREQAEKMRQQADELDDLADRQQQESMQNDQQTQQNDEAKQDQSSISDETQRQSENMQQPSGDARQKIEDAMEQQQQAAEQLEQGEQQAASESQREAAEKLREAANALREQADKQEGQQGEPQEGEQGEQSDENQEGEPGEQEGQTQDDRLAEWLLDREQRQREQRDQQLRAVKGRAVPVEKDW